MVLGIIDPLVGERVEEGGEVTEVDELVLDVGIGPAHIDAVGRPPH